MFEPDAVGIVKRYTTPTAGLPAQGSLDDISKIAVVSIAVSLKRIADILEGNPDKLGIGDMIGNMMHAMENSR